MIDSQPASCLAQTCNGPTDEIRSFRIWGTITLCTIRSNISPIAIGWRPGLLSKAIKRHAKNSSNDGESLSAVYSFLMTSAVALHKLVGLVPNCFHFKILLHPSASSPDDPTQPLVLTAALFSKSASIASNFIGCTCSGVSVSKTSNFASLPCGYFYFNWFKVFWFNGRIPFCMLSANSFIALVTFPLCISRVNFLEISVTVDGVFDGLKSFWILSPSCSKFRISSNVHKSVRWSNVFKCSLDFHFWDGFCSSKLCIIIIASNAMVVSSINCFPARSDGNRNKFFFDYLFVE